MEEINFDLTDQVIAVTTGGTGGHMYPAIVTAKELIKLGAKVTMITDQRGADKLEKANEQDINVKIITSSPLSGASVLGKCKSGLKVCLGIIQAWKYLGKLKPKAVIGFGGYASFPAVQGAVMRNINVIQHEQNAYLGKVNRMLAHKTKALGTSFHDVQAIPPHMHGDVEFVGMPVRPSVLDAREKRSQNAHIREKKHILITGGSQGAKIFSDVIPTALASLPQTIIENLKITFQSREEQVEETTSALAKIKGLEFDVNHFYLDLPDIMADSDLIIARSGSSTVAEICNIGVGSILIPYLYAADNHQYFNAMALQNIGASICMEQDKLSSYDLANHIIELLSNQDKLDKLSDHAYTLARPNAGKNMATLIAKTISR